MVRYRDDKVRVTPAETRMSESLLLRLGHPRPPTLTHTPFRSGYPACGARHETSRSCLRIVCRGDGACNQGRWARRAPSSLCADGRSRLSDPGPGQRHRLPSGGLGADGTDSCPGRRHRRHGTDSQAHAERCGPKNAPDLTSPGPSWAGWSAGPTTVRRTRSP